MGPWIPSASFNVGVDTDMSQILTWSQWSSTVSKEEWTPSAGGRVANSLCRRRLGRALPSSQ